MPKLFSKLSLSEPVYSINMPASKCCMIVCQFLLHLIRMYAVYVCCWRIFAFCTSAAQGLSKFRALMHARVLYKILEFIWCVLGTGWFNSTFFFEMTKRVWKGLGLLIFVWMINQVPHYRIWESWMCKVTKIEKNVI